MLHLLTCPIVAQNSFQPSMEPGKHDLVAKSNCTTCQFTEDFSNYWTAVLYFRARNGTYKRVPQLAQTGFEGTDGGGMLVYYMSDALFDTQQRSKVTAFKPVSFQSKPSALCLPLLCADDNRTHLRASACSSARSTTATASRRATSDS